MDPRTFGRYEIVRKLAGGGMGRVYLARDPNLDRQVGLKLIDSGADRESIEVISAERRGAMLQDQLAKREPGGRVAQIFEVGEREGYFFIAMEYIEGEDLSELMARGPMKPESAVAIAVDVLDVLCKAHTFNAVIEDKQHRGIIHGDIKPRNIRITPTGHVKVLDFGIAKAVSMSRSLTFNQFGSVPYSSPERLQTGDMDPRSDVWSVAIVLFEMLAGGPYFQAEGPSKLEWTIRNYKTLSPAINALPAGLREIVSRALDPDPARRFPSAAQLQTALRGWQTYGQNGAASADPDATRRTVYAPASATAADATRRTTQTPQPKPVSAGLPVAAFLRHNSNRLAVGFLVTVFLASVFGVVHEVRMWGNAAALSKQIDSGRISVADAAAAYRDLVKKSFLSLPLYPARHSLRDRYVADADRVIANFRQPSDSTPVYGRDWRTARASIDEAVSLAPDDKAIRGRAHLVEGYLKLRAGDPKGARPEFEDARALMPHSPDPHLGLALIYMNDADLDKAEEELSESQRDGFRPGRREQKGLADGYRKRGERWISVARKAHELGQMQDALKHADSDLEHAQSLYNAVAPFLNGVELAERMSAEREQARKLLAAAQTAGGGAPKEGQ